MNLSREIALWADKIRDITALGLHYSVNIYDQERYENLQQLAIEMLSVVTDCSEEEFIPLKETFFSRPLRRVSLETI